MIDRLNGWHRQVSRCDDRSARRNAPRRILSEKRAFPMDQTNPQATLACPGCRKVGTLNLAPSHDRGIMLECGACGRSFPYREVLAHANSGSMPQGEAFDPSSAEPRDRSRAG